MTDVLEQLEGEAHPVPKLIAEAELQEIWPLSDSTFFRMRRSREIPYLLIKGRVYYDVRELRAWLERHRVHARGHR